MEKDETFEGDSQFVGVQERSKADEIRDSVIDALSRMKDTGNLGYHGNTKGVSVEIMKGEEKWLVPEGIWHLRLAGPGEPPLGDLFEVFSPVKKENKLDLVVMSTDTLEFDEETGNFTPMYRYMMGVSRRDESDWEVCFTFDRNPPKKANMCFFMSTDTRDGGSKAVKAYLQFTNHTKAMLMLAKFGDFVTGKLKDRGFSDEYMSGFRDIIGRLQGMLQEGHDPSWVFSTRSRLEVGRDTSKDDELNGLYKLTLTRSFDPEVREWVLSIEPVEGTFSVGTPEAHADYVIRQIPGGRTDRLVRAEALFKGTRFFGMAFDFAVQAICELFACDKRTATIQSVRALQLKIRKMHNEGTPFNVLEGKYPDGANPDEKEETDG